MHTIIHPHVISTRQRSAARTASSETFRLPHYECNDQPGAMKLVVYLPGVSAAGVEIEGRGADLTITARKAHVVRVNWQAAHLEHAQHDYQLKLRLGHGFDFSAMSAEIDHGTLSLTVPKRNVMSFGLERVA